MHTNDVYSNYIKATFLQYKDIVHYEESRFILNEFSERLKKLQYHMISHNEDHVI